MKRYVRQHHMDGLFVLLSFGVFAVCVLLVLLTGADVCRSQTERDQAAWSRRTGAQYLTAKLRHADEAGAIGFSGGDGALWYDTMDLREEIGGETYVTRVYCYDGYIRELFTVDGGVYAPEDGEPVMAAQELRFGWDGELVQAVCVDADGQVSRSYFAPRSGEGADPS